MNKAKFSKLSTSFHIFIESRPNTWGLYNSIAIKARPDTRGLMITDQSKQLRHTSILVDYVGPPSAEVCSTAANFPQVSNPRFIELREV